MGRFVIQGLWALFVLFVLFVIAVGFGEWVAAGSLFCVLVCLGAIEEHLHQIAQNTRAIRARVAPKRSRKSGSGETLIALSCAVLLVGAMLGMWWLWHDQPELLDTLLGR